MRPIVIGTAGHVDHGKTALVKALTGTDTDRWEEEKRRGITIDLGFAEFELDGGVHASIVDVPGHEDFVRNMVAGATGVDVALLLVAADEGMMPQTEEHLAILEFLGVRAGVAVLSKIDLVADDWLSLVRDDLAERLARTAIAWESIVPASAQSGAGLDGVRAALRAAAAHVGSREADDLFRLPVDRVFTVAGTGTVVTGTTWSGSVAVGDDVTLLPGEHHARVRGIQVHGHPATAAVPGRRTALALSGADRSEIGRGSWVVSAAEWRETTVADAQVTLLPTAPPLTQRTRVRVHLGTAEVMARVTPAEDRIGPGEAGTVRLRFEAPVVARWGDRAVMRSYSPVTTVGGAIVADPRPRPRPRRPRPAAPLLSTPAERLRELLARAPEGIGRRDLPVRLGLRPEEGDALVQDGGEDIGTIVGDRLVGAAILQRTHRRLVDALTRFHHDDPLQPGMPRELLRKRIGDPLVVDHVETALEREGRVIVEGATVRLADHEAQLGPDLEPIAAAMRNALTDAGFEGCTPSELALACGTDTKMSTRILEFLVRQGTAARVGRERYYDDDALQRMVAAASQEVLRSGQLGPAQLRESLGLTRKYLIPFLEWLDTEGYTARDGDIRRPGPRLTKTSARL